MKYDKRDVERHIGMHLSAYWDYFRKKEKKAFYNLIGIFDR